MGDGAGPKSECRIEKCILKFCFSFFFFFFFFSSSFNQNPVADRSAFKNNLNVGVDTLASQRN